MSFINNLKKVAKDTQKSMQDAQAKRKSEADALALERGDWLANRKTEYIGGYQDFPKANGTLMFFSKRVEFHANARSSFVLDTKTILGVSIEGRHEVNRRVTVTRMLAIGIFAFAAKKKTEEKESFLTISLTDGQEVLFRVADIAPLELKSKLASATSKVQQGRAASAMGNNQLGSVADELKKLSELQESGAITKEEFDQQKQKLLS